MILTNGNGTGRWSDDSVQRFFGAPTFQVGKVEPMRTSRFALPNQQRTHANLKAHLLEIRSCRAPNGLGVMNETIALGALFLERRPFRSAD